MANVYTHTFIYNENNFTNILGCVTAKDHKIVTGIYNYLIHYPFHNLVAQQEPLLTVVLDFL